ISEYLLAQPPAAYDRVLQVSAYTPGEGQS
ncbi:hypothetical protein X777_01561, partial [Ooceraea biroi]